MASQVLKVRVMDPGTHEQHITDFKLSNNEVWSKAQMLIFLRMDQRMFYTNVDGKVAEVMIAKTEQGHEYIKTKPDNTTKNNLLHLPRF